MKGLSWTTCISISYCVAACSVYPLPQDVSGYSSKDIVARIRCEARNAIRETAIQYISEYDEVVTKDNKTGTSYAKELQENPDLFVNAKSTNLIGKAGERFSYYKNSQIAYVFSLKGLESNTQGFDLALERKFGLRKDNLGFKSESQLSRDITRSFFLWDKFEELIKVPNSYCNKSKIVNIVYPSTGMLPIKDLIYNYIEINQLGIFAIRSGEKDAKTIAGTEEAPAIPAMGDTMIFKTRFDGNISPTFNYNPAGAGLLVSSLTLKDDNYREDTHTVIITVSTAPVKIISHSILGKFTKQAPTDASRLQAAADSTAAQQSRRFQDAVINLSSGLSRIPQ